MPENSQGNTLDARRPSGLETDPSGPAPEAADMRVANGSLELEVASRSKSDLQVDSNRVHVRQQSPPTPFASAHSGDSLPDSPLGHHIPPPRRHGSEQAWDELTHGKGFWYYQPQADWLYQHHRCQICIALLIGFNFSCNILEKEIDPKGSGPHFQRFRDIEVFFNMAFFGELLLNMYSSWFWKFWKSSWNQFDFLVVTIGVCNTFEALTGLEALPPQLSMLRNMRAFRVFRLFKRIESLNKIIVSLANALPGMMNAVVIITLVMCFYSILAVDLFRGYGAIDYFVPYDPEYCHKAEIAITWRNFCLGPEYFGDFLASFFTLFQILIGDSWSEAVVRPLFHTYDVSPHFDPTSNALEDVGIAFFFVSFILINAVVLINVVVAVLLANMVTPPDDGNDQSNEDDEDNSKGAAFSFHTLTADISTLRKDMGMMHEKVSEVAQDLTQRLTTHRDDMSSMKEDLEDVLAKMRALQSAQRQGGI